MRMIKVYALLRWPNGLRHTMPKLEGCTNQSIQEMSNESSYIQALAIFHSHNASDPVLSQELKNKFKKR